MKSTLFIISSLSGGNAKILTDVAIDQSFKNDVFIEIITDIYDVDLINEVRKYKIKYRLGQNSNIEKLTTLIKILIDFKKNKKDLVISFDARSNLYSFILKVVFGISWVAGIHGLKGAFTKKWSIINKIILKKSLVCIVPSFAVQNKLISKNILLKKKIKVIHNGINIPDELQKRYLENSFKICLIGNFYSPVIKGHKIAIDAIKLLPKKFSLTIFGDGKYYNHYKDYIKSSNLISRVNMPGACDLEIIKKELTNALCVVAPSSTEAFGVSILESMSFGVPVIANKTGGISEIIDHGINGILINEVEPKKLANEIMKLSDNAHVNNILGEAAFKKVKTIFKKSTMLSKYDNVINR